MAFLVPLSLHVYNIAIFYVFQSDHMMKIYSAQYLHHFKQLLVPTLHYLPDTLQRNIQTHLNNRRADCFKII